MKILITGANGFLGQHLTLYLSGKGFDVYACSRGACRIAETDLFHYQAVDLTDEVSVSAMLAEVKPDIIIHSAAMSKPDECESDRELCVRQNVEVTRYLLAYSPETVHFIFISTDFVFGDNGPHSEDDDTEPLNFYGKSKLMAEELVEKSGLNYAIVRPVFIYGPVLSGMRPGFLQWVKDSLDKAGSINVVSDQQRTPTYVMDICKGIEAIILQKAMGAFHLAGKDILSPWQMATAVAAFLNLDATLIKNVTSDLFIEKVQRAKRSGLKIDKAIAVLAYEPVNFEEGLQLTFKQR